MFSTSKEDIKKNWGTSGLTSISELVTGDNFQKFLANNTKLLFGDNYTDSNSGSNSQKPKEINLFNEIEKIKVEIDKFVNNRMAMVLIVHHLVAVLVMVMKQF
nr:hypothetical protein [Mycoplasmopsis bovis]